MNQFYPLHISAIRTITTDAVALSFELPSLLKDQFYFKPGQYLTLRFDLRGTDVRRSYSICNSPLDEDQLQIGVKRVKNHHIVDELKVGDSVEVMPPNGRFYADVKTGQQKTYYLFAAGSGITPILSILHTVLQVEPESKVYMMYGNQNQNSIMFLDEINQLKNTYSERFSFHHYLSKPKGMFSKKKKIEHRKGRIKAALIKTFLDDYQPTTDISEYYICGPAGMINDTEQALISAAISKDSIFIEYFTVEEEGDANNEGAAISGEELTDEGIAANLKAYLEGETLDIDIEPGQTILQSLIEAGYNPPYSCESGVCSTCMCQLKKGKVHMKSNMVLSDDEIDKGYILSCQSVPLTRALEVEYLE